MHYKCHLFMMDIPNEGKVLDILRPFHDEMKNDYEDKVRFIWRDYEVGGRYALWNGGVMKLSNTRHFYPNDCFILLDDRGNAIARDMYFTPPGECNQDFSKKAWEMYYQYKNGYVVVIDIWD